MTFGQPSGPPATQRQMNELLELLQRAGHTDFRDARGPLGFTQRQAGGKFTRGEADAYIEQLSEEVARDAPPTASGDTDDPTLGDTDDPTLGDAADPSLRVVPDRHLAAELQRRGWIVMEP